MVLGEPIAPHSASTCKNCKKPIAKFNAITIYITTNSLQFLHSRTFKQPFPLTLFPL